MITVNSRRYDGSIRRTWTCELVSRRDPEIVLVGEFDTAVDHADLGHIPTGTITYEYYWLDRWYNIFRFHRPTGELQYFYCNINMPPTFDGRVLDYVDLDIDVLVQPDMTCKVLDRDDFDRNSATYGYSADVRTKAEAAVRDILDLIQRDRLPQP